MSPEDSEIWNCFLTKYPNHCDYIYYDLPVGEIPDLDKSNCQMNYERYARQTYSKRIDVVAIVGTNFEVIELKPRAGMVAFGQVLMYLHCIKKLLPPGSMATGTIITGKADPDLLPLAEAHDIQVIELAGQA